MDEGLRARHCQTRRVAILLAALAIVLLMLVVQASPAAAATKPTNVCFASFPHPKRVTYKIHDGTKTVYNQDESRTDICTGSFGLPNGVDLSLGAQCDMIATVYGLANPADSDIGDIACDTYDATFGGGVGAAAKDILCGFVADTLGYGAGIFAAGVTANPGVGVLVWKGATFFGNTVLCVGLADGGAKAWGEQHETNHEVAVAHDVITEHKCLQYTQQKTLGVTHSTWNAVPCPKGFTTNDPSPFHAPPTPSAAPGVVLGLSIDGVALGDSYAQVNSILGNPIDGPGGFAESWPETSPVNYVEFNDGTAVVVSTQSPSERTNQGIGVGSSLPALETAYPSSDCSAYSNCTLTSSLNGQTVCSGFELVHQVDGAVSVTSIDIFLQDGAFPGTAPGTPC